MDKDAYWLDTRMDDGGTCTYGIGGGTAGLLQADRQVEPTHNGTGPHPVAGWGPVLVRCAGQGMGRRTPGRVPARTASWSMDRPQ